MGPDDKPPQTLPLQTFRHESFPLQPLSRKDTTSTTATTSSTSSSTWTSSSTSTSHFPSAGHHLAQDALHKLRLVPRPRSWHPETPSAQQKRELENHHAHRQAHQQNLYTACGRHSNEWLFSGWGDLVGWALGSAHVSGSEIGSGRKCHGAGRWEEEKFGGGRGTEEGMSVRRDE